MNQNAKNTIVLLEEEAESLLHKLTEKVNHLDTSEDPVYNYELIGDLYGVVFGEEDPDLKKFNLLVDQLKTEVDPHENH